MRAGLIATPSTSSGRTRTCSTASTPAPELLRQLGARLLGPAGPARAGDPRAAARQGAATRSSPKTYKPPTTDGSGNIRDNLRQAVRLLKEAGWEVKGGKLVNAATGQPLALRDPARARPAFERVVAALRQEPGAAGRRGDRAHGRRRAVPAPAAGLRLRHDRRPSAARASRRATSSATSGAAKAADTQGSQNYVGIKDPAVDALIGWSSPRPTARTWWPHAAPSTACCCGTTT